MFDDPFNCGFHDHERDYNELDSVIDILWLWSIETIVFDWIKLWFYRDIIFLAAINKYMNINFNGLLLHWKIFFFFFAIYK